MKTVFVDVDTQLDFMIPSGALYVPGAEELIPTIARLNRFAADHGIPVLSTVDAHSENDPEFSIWPPHCVRGTTGQHKVAGTLIDKYPAQFVFEKQTVEFGSTAPFLAEIERLGADRFVVYGVVTEHCVRSAASGLLKAAKRVEVVTDAIRSIDEQAGAQVLSQLHAAGATLTTSAAIAGTN